MLDLRENKDNSSHDGTSAFISPTCLTEFLACTFQPFFSATGGQVKKV